jgi:dnd system-associated protein 4
MSFRANKNLFFRIDQTIYWDGQYEDIMFMMRGLSPKQEKTHAPMYSTFAEASILAAAIGLREDRKKPLNPENRKEIPLSVYKGRALGDTTDPTLDQYIALISIIKLKDIKLLEDDHSDENQRKMILTFQELLNGGLEFLRGELTASSDSTGRSILFDQIQKALKTIDTENSEAKPLIDIFSIKY